MISIVIKSDRNANWSFYQDKSDMTAIIRRNRVIIALENPGRGLSNTEAAKMLHREIRRYGESLRDSKSSRYSRYDKKRKYDNRRKIKYGWQEN